VAAFGLLDEAHQSFVPGREASLLDALADATGAGLGLMATLAPGFRSRRLGPLSWQRGCGARPVPGRPLLLVADPHWGSDLSSLEAATEAHPDADWLFLGDVFDVWVGIPGMESPAQSAFLAWVDHRRAAGRWVGLWLGNREYFLDRHAARFDLMGEGVGGRLAGEGLAFEHGDLVNAGDGAYRTWNLLSRSGPLWLAFSLLPARRAAALAGTLEARLRTTNQAYKLAFPREAFAAAAVEAAPDTFITGHFHTHEVAGNGTALPWAHGGEFWVWRSGRLEPLQSSRNEASSSANPGSSS
jgi:UDP-2,3-diacylglucosamine pyrophosphatase LpxH